jgi:hypothetical protein
MMVWDCVCSVCYEYAYIFNYIHTQTRWIELMKIIYWRIMRFESDQRCFFSCSLSHSHKKNDLNFELSHRVLLISIEPNHMVWLNPDDTNPTKVLDLFVLFLKSYNKFEILITKNNSMVNKISNKYTEEFSSKFSI